MTWLHVGLCSTIGYHSNSRACYVKHEAGRSCSAKLQQRKEQKGLWISDHWSLLDAVKDTRWHCVRLEIGVKPAATCRTPLKKRARLWLLYTVFDFVRAIMMTSVASQCVMAWLTECIRQYCRLSLLTKSLEKVNSVTVINAGERSTMVKRIWILNIVHLLHSAGKILVLLEVGTLVFRFGLVWQYAYVCQQLSI